MHSNCSKQAHQRCLDSKHFLLCLNCTFSQRDIELPTFLYDEDCNNDNRKHIPLEVEMKPWFHKHAIVRHPIDQQQSWVCSCEDPSFADQIVLLGYLDSKCESSVSQALIRNHEQSMYQGYGCKECSWHICVGCLIKFISCGDPENYYEAMGKCQKKSNDINQELLKRIK